MHRFDTFQNREPVKKNFDQLFYLPNHVDTTKISFSSNIFCNIQDMRTKITNRHFNNYYCDFYLPFFFGQQTTNTLHLYRVCLAISFS